MISAISGTVGQFSSWAGRLDSARKSDSLTLMWVLLRLAFSRLDALSQFRKVKRSPAPRLGHRTERLLQVRIHREIGPCVSGRADCVMTQRVRQRFLAADRNGRQRGQGDMRCNAPKLRAFTVGTVELLSGQLDRAQIGQVRTPE